MEGNEHIHIWEATDRADRGCIVGSCLTRESDLDSSLKSDIEKRADLVDDFREVVQNMVVGLVNDGFTDQQAREIVAGFWRSTGRPGSDE